MVAPRLRTPLPAALVLLGVALSCSTACFHVYESGRGRPMSQAEIKAEQDKMERKQREQMLQSLRPSMPKLGNRDGELDVTTNGSVFRIVATGDFAPETTEVFLAAVRRLYKRGFSFGNEVDVAIYRRVASAPQLVLGCRIAPLSDLNARLRQLVPSGVRRADIPEFRIGQAPNGTIELFVRGDFTEQSTRPFVVVAEKWRDEFPLPPGMEVEFHSRELSDSLGRGKLVARFEYPPITAR